MSEIDIDDHDLGMLSHDPYMTLTQIMEQIMSTLAAQQAQITALNKQINNMRSAYVDDIGEIRKPQPDQTSARALIDLRCITMQSLDRLTARHAADIQAIRSEQAAQQKTMLARLDTLERETRGMFAEYIKRKSSTAGPATHNLKTDL